MKYFKCVLALFIFSIFIYAFSIFYGKYSLNYNKEVILGGMNIGLYPGSDTNGVAYTSNLANIGTLTYTDDGKFAALGHRNGVSSGTVVNTKVIGINKNDKDLGSIIAVGYYNKIIGTFDTDTNIGVYGKFYNTDLEETIEVGMPKEIKKDVAYIKTTISNNESEYFKIKIYFIEYLSKKTNIYFEVIDEKLLEKTGGIIKGMSGSPIIQHNKIIGAVNSVNKINPKKGYGVFITSMLEK